MAAKNEKSETPWYLRGRALILAIGAIAAALLAVFSLWDRLVPADVEDAGTITSAQVIRRISLGEFAKNAQGAEISLSPRPGAMAFRTVAFSRVDPSVGPGSASTETETSSKTATPTQSATPSRSATPSGSASTSRSVTPSVSTTPSKSGTVRPKWPPPKSYLDPLVHQRVLGDWRIPLTTIPKLLPDIVGTDQQGQPGGGAQVQGEELTTGEVARRLARALGEVKYVQKEGKKDPLGWVVAVNLDSSGLEGVPLLLTWSLDGLDIPESWSADRIAYRLIATTAHDSGSVEVWVPDLKKQGSYNVNLTLAHESDGNILTRANVEVPSR